jgi:ribosome biogenesis GTPase
MLADNGSIVSGKLAAKKVDLVAGDRVTFEQGDAEVFVKESQPAQRSLYRTFHGTLRRMGANIDQLCVITASGATWNAVAIDRMLAAARVQSIPTVLVVNKIDLGIGEIAEMVNTYAKVGIPVIQCSAKRGDGVDQVRALLEQSSVRVMALCGVSGVGKSTILNALVPGAKTRIGEVSDKTGQGRQTTSQPRGFLYSAADKTSKIVIDLPGVQFFGLAHLAPQDVTLAFEEIAQAALRCQFRDCGHVKEKNCAVREAVDRGEIASWRYHSFLQILEEIEDAKEY